MQFSTECCISHVHFWNKKYSNMYGNELNKEQMENIFFLNCTSKYQTGGNAYIYRILE